MDVGWRVIAVLRNTHNVGSNTEKYISEDGCTVEGDICLEEYI